jgi:hypothetical protein
MSTRSSLDYLLYRRRQLSNQGWHRDDLITFRELRMNQQIHHLNLVLTL